MLQKHLQYNLFRNGLNFQQNYRFRRNLRQLEMAYPIYWRMELLKNYMGG